MLTHGGYPFYRCKTNWENSMEDKAFWLKFYRLIMAIACLIKDYKIAEIGKLETTKPDATSVSTDFLNKS